MATTCATGPQRGAHRSDGPAGPRGTGVRHRLGLALGTALAGSAPGPALAHGSAKGLGAFWNGVVHPVVEPVQLLALLALGLWLGIHALTPRDERRTVISGAAAFVGAVLLAALSARAVPLADSGWPERLLQALGLGLALATVADRRQPRLLPLACGLTLLGTALASPAGELRGLHALGWVAGVALGTTLTVSYAALATRWVRRRPGFGTIVPRVLASWLAASLLLVLLLPLFPAARPAASPAAAPAAESAPASR